MARPLRLEYDGAFYHVTSRGNERGKIFFTEGDYGKSLIYLLKRHTGMANRAIGEQFAGLSYSAVTKSCRSLEEGMGKNRRLRTIIGRIDRELSHVKG